MGETKSRPTIPVSASTIPHVGLKATIDCLLVLLHYWPSGFLKSDTYSMRLTALFLTICQTPWPCMILV